MGTSIGPVSEAGLTPLPLRGAAALVIVEGLTLVGIAVFFVVEIFAATPESVGAALVTAASALAAGVALVALARQLALAKRWARSPVVVLELLLLPTGFTLSFQAGQPEYGVPLLAVALAILALLATPDARAPFEDE